MDAPGGRMPERMASTSISGIGPCRLGGGRALGRNSCPHMAPWGGCGCVAARLSVMSCRSRRCGGPLAVFVSRAGAGQGLHPRPANIGQRGAPRGRGFAMGAIFAERPEIDIQSLSLRVLVSWIDRKSVVVGKRV